MWAHEYWIDEDEPRAESGRFVTGLVVGISVGAAAALLLAPSPGAALRRQVKSSAQRLGRRAADAYDGASQVVGDAVARSRRAIDAGREALQRARSVDARSAAADATMP